MELTTKQIEYEIADKNRTIEFDKNATYRFIPGQVIFF